MVHPKLDQAFNSNLGSDVSPLLVAYRVTMAMPFAGKRIRYTYRENGTDGVALVIIRGCTDWI